ncbi:M16 family metallopeptidase [Microbulbifer sp.]|uniref:M16 family metallopeptidase n=1 Tax=Microbulbifer sp. TaxID=1908541 RepID=UPI003F2C276A
MKRFNSILWMVLILVAPGAWAGMAERIVEMEVNGIEVYAYPMQVKNVVTVMGSLPAGDLLAERAGNLAVAGVTSDLLTAGTTFDTEDEFRKELVRKSAGIQFWTDRHALYFSLRSRTEDLPRVIQLFAQALRSPAFLPEKFERVKKAGEGMLSNLESNPGMRASGAMSRLLYPEGHPNREPSIRELQADLQKLTLEDVKAFHRKYYGPAAMKMVFAGDLDRAHLEKLLGDEFAGWSGGVDYVREAPRARVKAAAIQSIPMPDVSSVQVAWGLRTGLRSNDKDALALSVANEILGSGFTGRLMSTVRDKEGLTYGIRSFTSGDRYVDGSWGISASFAPELLDKGIAITRRELERWWKKGVSAEELEMRKTAMIGEYRIGFDGTGGVAAAIMQVLERGRPLSWLDEYPRAIAALDVDQVNAAIRKYIDPEKIVLVKAGVKP